MANGTNSIQKTHDRATRTLQTTEGEHKCSGRGAVPASRVAPVVLLWKRIYLSEKQNKIWPIVSFNFNLIVIIIKSPNLAMLTSNDKQTTTLSILWEVNVATKKIAKITRKIYYTSVLPAGNRVQLLLFPSLGIVKQTNKQPNKQTNKHIIRSNVTIYRWWLYRF